MKLAFNNIGEIFVKSIDRILHLASRILFVGALLAVAFAFIEWLLLAFEISMIGQSYAPGRIIELAAALMIIVIGMTLRQIRSILTASKTAP